MSKIPSGTNVDLYLEWVGELTPDIPSKLLGLTCSYETRKNFEEIKEEVDIPGIGVLKIKDDTAGDRHGGLWDGTFVAVLTVIGNVAIGVLANWIYGRLKSASPPKIRINKKEITVITEDSITKILEESIEVQADDES